MLQAGQPAPAFALPDADLQIFEFRDLLGKHHMVLYFYPKDDTAGCTREAIEFSDLQDQFERQGCRIVGVSPDDCFSHGDFRDKHGITVLLLSDMDRDVCRLYGVWRDGEGEGGARRGLLRSTFVIDNKGMIRHALYNVSVRGHAAEVLELVKRLED